MRSSSIFINHIPGIYFERFTHRNLSFSDSAELFVFLAGWSLGYLVGGSDAPKSTPRLMLRLGGRAFQIYAAQILISSIAIAILASAAFLLDNPLILEWHNAAAVFLDPALTHIGLVLLTHQLGYFDILPLYVVLMVVAAPLIALIYRFARPLLLPLSLGIYLAALIVPITVPTWPVPGQWFFNPFAWQLLFVLGFALSRPDGIGGFCAAPHRRHPACCTADRGAGRRRRPVQPVSRPDHFSRSQSFCSSTARHFLRRCGYCSSWRWRRWSR